VRAPCEPWAHAKLVDIAHRERELVGAVCYAHLDRRALAPVLARIGERLPNDDPTAHVRLSRRTRGARGVVCLNQILARLLDDDPQDGLVDEHRAGRLGIDLQHVGLRQQRTQHDLQRTAPAPHTVHAPQREECTDAVESAGAV
jgi:hypothetical protein